jgi:putative DNA primase/helicase
MKARNQAQPPIDLNALNQMLGFITAETDRNQWVRVLMAIKSEFGDAAMEVAQQWSATASNFKPKDFDTTWKSIKPKGAVSIATLVRLAVESGYQFAPMTQSDQRKLAQQAKERKAQQAKAQALEAQRLQAQHLSASDQAWLVMQNAQPAPSNPPYLVSKGIAAHGVLFGRVLSYQNALIIPVYGTDGAMTGKVQSIQFIQPDGTKRFLSGGKKAGGYYPVQWVEDAPIVICEGFATGATLAEHYTPFSSVICAFDAGNLLAVAKAFKRQYPMTQIIIAGDNDHLDQDGQPTRFNTGRIKAKEAAKAIDALISIPEFDSLEPGSDWNDRHQLDQQNQVLFDCEQTLLGGDAP